MPGFDIARSTVGALGSDVSTGEIAAASLVTEAEAIASNDNDTTIPTSAAVKDYSDNAAATMTNKTLTSPVLNTGVSGTAIVDEDNMVSDSATKVPTQQSVKAYVDSGAATMTNKTLTSPVLTTPQINDTSADHQYVIAVSELAADRTVTLPLLAAADTFLFETHAATLLNKTFDANGTGNSITNINTADIVDATATPTASKIPVADGSGLLDGWISAASTTVDGLVELAIASEINTGTDATRAVTPDSLAGSNFGIRYVQIEVFGPTTDVATGDGKKYFHIPAGLGGMNLVEVHAQVVTAGTTNSTTVQIHNLTQTADMLSALLEVETGETGSDTSDPGPTIDTGNDDVATNDVLRIDVDTISTTAPKGLFVTLGFQTP